MILGILAFPIRSTKPTPSPLYRDQYWSLTDSLLLILSFVVLGQPVGEANFTSTLLGSPARPEN